MAETAAFEEALKDLMDKIFDRLGGGFKECIYQNALAYEMRNLNWEVAKEVNFPVLYEDTVELGIVRFDLLVNSAYLIEFKALQKVSAKEENQIKRYLRLSDLAVGFVVNVSLNKYEIIKVYC